MAPEAVIALLFVFGFPIAWLASEFGNWRGVRITLGMAAIASCFGIAYLVGHFSRFNYNAWYGGASKELIDATINEIEAGNLGRVMGVLRRLNLDYQPTYEHRAHYDEAVREAVKIMKEGEAPLGSKWDPSPFTTLTWIGHWENDSGYWLVIRDGATALDVQRSGENMPKMHNVVLSLDARTLTFDEGGQWHHVLTLTNKFEALHEWRTPDTGRLWQTETIHKLIRATAEQRRFTRQ